MLRSVMHRLLWCMLCSAHANTRVKAFCAARWVTEQARLHGRPIFIHPATNSIKAPPPLLQKKASNQCGHPEE